MQLKTGVPILDKKVGSASFASNLPQRPLWVVLLRFTCVQLANNLCEVLERLRTKSCSSLCGCLRAGQPGIILGFSLK